LTNTNIKKGQKMFKKMMMIIVGILLIYSCKENSTDTLEPQNIISYKVSNANNPYEYVGDLHRIGLENIKNNYLNQINPNVVIDSSQRVNNIINIVSVFTKSNVDSVLGNNIANVDSIKFGLNSISVDYQINQEGYINELLNDVGLSSDVKTYINQLSENTDIGNLDSLELINPISSISYKIINTESIINFDNNLTNDEKFELLVLTSVLRDSYSYWFDEYTNQNSLWRVCLPVIKKVKDSKLMGKNGAIVATVAAAAAWADGRGAIVGAAKKLVFGPEGAVVGAVGGAIKGTACHFIEEAALGFITWLF
jgi:hypothetical protein